MLSLYVYDPCKKGLRHLKSSIKKIEKLKQVNFKIITMTTDSRVFLNKIKPCCGNLFLLPYESSDQGLHLGKAIRRKDPKGVLVYWIQEPVDYLKIIQSNIEVLDVLDKREEDFYNKLKNIILWTQIRIKEDSYSALS